MQPPPPPSVSLCDENGITHTIPLTHSTSNGNLKPGNSSEKKTRIAFLTSGGDSPGMNAAIRAIVRMAIHCDCEPFAIIEGYKGLISGGAFIVPFGWNDVAHIIGEGGTIIKSSRCPEFMERKWRKKAAKHLVHLGIDKLIVIGGDGSLTGADTFRQEWRGLLEELVADGEISQQQYMDYEHMMVVGLVGSIDNDMAGTEITIGANSSLHRIIEAVDCIHSTASSHQRAFVIEVMGRRCGWLALNAAISAGADWLLIPEDPPKEGWEERMTTSIARHRQLGRSVTVVIVAEGAVDLQNKPIKSEYVKDILQKSGFDARVTCLGHIQRGGAPSAFDRYLATMQGIKAVEAALEANPSHSPSLLVSMNENKISCKPLMECVTKTRSVAKAMNELNFDGAFELRDADFKANYAMWKLFHQGVDDKTHIDPNLQGLRVGVMHCGAPCAGMNAAAWAIFLYGKFKGFSIMGIFNGFEGLMTGDCRELERNDMFGMVGKGGSFLGTNRTLPDVNMALVAERIQTLGLNAMIMIGGFEAYNSVLQMTKARAAYAALSIPMIVIPATISNNVPGTEYSIGSDTALNVILQNCDYIRQSASSSRKRVFVVDVHGGYCGYLATLAGLGAGASRAYIHEEGVNLTSLRRDAIHLRSRFREDKRQGRLLIRNESCNKIYTAELISKILEQEGGGAFDSRWVVLGHLQQGGNPSPLDRIRAVRLAALSMSYIECLLSPESVKLSTVFKNLSAGVESPISVYRCCGEPGESSDESACSSSGEGEITRVRDAVVIGIKGPRLRFTSAVNLERRTDMKLRRPLNQWWMCLRQYLRILAKFDDSSLRAASDATIVADEQQFRSD